MLPTLAERLREQQAKGRSRPASRAPWPVPSEPPTALLFQVRPVLAEPEPPAPFEPEPEPRLAAPAPMPARTALGEALLLLFLAVLIVMDGVLALASLINQASRRQRLPQASSSPAPSAALAMRAEPWALAANP